jgi:hypothetical protein
MKIDDEIENILYKFEHVIKDIVDQYVNDTFVIKIVCWKGLNSIAEYISLILNKMHISVSIQDTLSLEDMHSNDIYFFIGKPQYCDKQLIFPRYYIFYQIEQNISDLLDSPTKIWTELELPDKELRACLNNRAIYVQYMNNSNFVLEFSKNNYRSYL